MQTFTIKVAQDATYSAGPNFKLWADGKLKIDEPWSTFGSPQTLTFSCYRDGHWFSFPNSTHSLEDGFATDGHYAICALYPSRIWTSYLPHIDAKFYNVEVVKVIEN